MALYARVQGSDTMNMLNRGFEAPAHVHGKTHKKKPWHVRDVGGLQARTAIRSRAAIASFRHCFGREDMQILRLDVESSLWPARPFASHARMKDDCCQKPKERSFVVTLFVQSHRFTKLRAWKLRVAFCHRTPTREECAESRRLKHSKLYSALLLRHRDCKVRWSAHIDRI